ncbi:TPA: hypothetical protein N2828_004522, partial [Vibrio parahaemolyticus]|nr:hypothetical protein [Vibrio parahaemolyticus]
MTFLVCGGFGVEVQC